MWHTPSDLQREPERLNLESVFKQRRIHVMEKLSIFKIYIVSKLKLSNHRHKNKNLQEFQYGENTYFKSRILRTMESTTTGWFFKVHSQATHVQTLEVNLTKAFRSIPPHPGELEEWSKSLEEHEKLAYSQGETLVPRFKIFKIIRKAKLRDKNIEIQTLI